MSDVDRHAERIRAAANMAYAYKMPALESLEWFEAEVTRLREDRDKWKREAEQQRALRGLDPTEDREWAELNARCVRLEAALQELKQHDADSTDPAQKLPSWAIRVVDEALAAGSSQGNANA